MYVFSIYMYRRLVDSKVRQTLFQKTFRLSPWMQLRKVVSILERKFCQYWCEIARKQICLCTCRRDMTWLLNFFLNANTSRTVISAFSSAKAYNLNELKFDRFIKGESIHLFHFTLASF